MRQSLKIETRKWKRDHWSNHDWQTLTSLKWKRSWNAVILIKCNHHFICGKFLHAWKYKSIMQHVFLHDSRLRRREDVCLLHVLYDKWLVTGHLLWVFICPSQSYQVSFWFYDQVLWLETTFKMDLCWDTSCRWSKYFVWVCVPSLTYLSTTGIMEVLLQLLVHPTGSLENIMRDWDGS